MMEKPKENLREFLNNNLLTYSQKLKLSISIFNTISQLHSINIVHGNIKSKTIMIVNNSIMEIKLADFGSAYTYDEEYNITTKKRLPLIINNFN